MKKEVEKGERMKMLMKQLLEKLEYTCIQGNLEKEITAVVYDSRKIVEGCMFICIEGPFK